MVLDLSQKRYLEFLTCFQTLARQVWMIREQGQKGWNWFKTSQVSGRELSQIWNSKMLSSIGGSVVECSPATRATRVRFPADATCFGQENIMQDVNIMLAILTRVAAGVKCPNRQNRQVQIFHICLCIKTSVPGLEPGIFCSVGRRVIHCATRPIDCQCAFLHSGCLNVCFSAQK